MRVILLVLTMVSFFGFCQEDQYSIAKTTSENWIKNRLENEADSYKLISFSELEEIQSQSPETNELMDSVTKLKYDYFNEMSAKKSIADFKEYDDKQQEFKALKIALQDQNKIVLGYTLLHKFSTKNIDDFKVDYTCTYSFNKDLEIQETSLRKYVNRDNGDY